MVENHILKLVLGPGFQESPNLAEKRSEYKSGLLDEYNCFIYIPPITSHESPSANKQFSYIKVRDVRKYMFEV